MDGSLNKPEISLLTITPIVVCNFNGNNFEFDQRKYYFSLLFVFSRVACL